MSKNIILFFVLCFFFNCSSEQKEELHISELNIHTNLNAEIIFIEAKNNILISGQYYLKITNIKDSVSYIVDYDILDGQGGYESAIVNIKWLSDSLLFIERNLYDRGQNLIYNLNNLRFTNIQDSVPPVDAMGKFYNILSDSNIAILDSARINTILFSMKALPIKIRYKILEHNEGNIYTFAENILKSDLHDTLKLKFYLDIQPLFPNNAELGSVLGYELIDNFDKYKRQPIKSTLNSIQDPKLKKKARNALSDADIIN